MQARVYQERDAARLWEAFAKYRKVIYKLPTGAGKTHVAGMLSTRLRADGGKMLVLVHRRELVDQSCRTLDRAGLGGEYGVIQSGRPPSPWAPIQVASVFTLAKRLEQYARIDFQMIVIDECHHAKARTWERILQRWPRAWHLGLTATPGRLDGKPLGDLFEKIIAGPNIGQLVQRKYLAPTEMLWIPQGLDTKGLKMSRRTLEYKHSEINQRLTPKVVANAVRIYREHLAPRKAVFFGATVEHSVKVAGQLSEAGYPAVHVDGRMDMPTRERKIREFRSGDASVLCNYAIISEGFDVPECDGVIMARETKSLVEFMQQAGRGMRPDGEGDGGKNGAKVCRLIDTCGNYLHHGHPMVERPWSLHTEPQADSESSDAGGGYGLCEQCSHIYRLARGACPYCGHERPKQEVVEVDVDRFELAPVAASVSAHVPPDRQPRHRQVDVNRRIARIMHSETTNAQKADAVVELCRELSYSRKWGKMKIRHLGLDR